jgi:hypothetical protein
MQSLRSASRPIGKFTFLIFVALLEDTFSIKSILCGRLRAPAQKI